MEVSFNLKTFSQRSPVKFFLLVYALAIPLWIIVRFLNIKGPQSDIPVMEIFAAFTLLTVAFKKNRLNIVSIRLQNGKNIYK